MSSSSKPSISIIPNGGQTRLSSVSTSPLSMEPLSSPSHINGTSPGSDYTRVRSSSMESLVPVDNSASASASASNATVPYPDPSMVCSEKPSFWSILPSSVANQHHATFYTLILWLFRIVVIVVLFVIVIDFAGGDAIPSKVSYESSYELQTPLLQIVPYGNTQINGYPVVSILDGVTNKFISVIDKRYAKVYASKRASNTNNSTNIPYGYLIDFSPFIQHTDVRMSEFYVSLNASVTAGNSFCSALQLTFFDGDPTSRQNIINKFTQTTYGLELSITGMASPTTYGRIRSITIGSITKHIQNIQVDAPGIDYKSQETPLIRFHSQDIPSGSATDPLTYVVFKWQHNVVEKTESFTKRLHWVTVFAFLPLFIAAFSYLQVFDQIFPEERVYYKRKGKFEWIDTIINKITCTSGNNTVQVQVHPMQKDQETPEQYPKEQ